MNCDEFAELVTAYLDDALDDSSRPLFLDHMARCSGCTGYYGQFTAAITALGELPAPGLSPQTRSHLLTAFREASSEKPE
ncbi:zf-HC2 domain-containing protein [Herbidospora galbida]|uniref:Zf-HC2 domain-containing protein n=1 Tax=Herbidospora galbida TaxID=2575442 RepID=A0A4U3MG19_9ACTN|nr:zf-HC2 domain-containing protein [Herbidospora galbida]TKK87382.1 zf-HC2 domain-containing protein [Herbidospora galbida]